MTGVAEVVQDTTVAQEGDTGTTIRTVVYSDGSGFMETVEKDGSYRKSGWDAEGNPA